MRRALKIAGLSLGVVLLVLLVSVAWLTGTEGGTRLVLSQIQERVDGIAIGTIQGRLAGNLRLDDVQVSTEGFELTLSRLWLSWAPGALLGGTLQVAEVGMEGVVYRPRPTPEPTTEEAFSLPDRIDLPVDVVLARLDVTDVTVYPAPDAEPLQVDQLLATEVSYIDAHFELPRLELASPLLDADGRLAATAAGDYPLDIELDWRLVLADYAPIEGTTTLDGSLAALQLNQRLSAPYHTTVDAVVNGLVDAGQATRLTAQVAVRDLRLAEVQTELPDAALSLDLEAEGPLDSLEIRARANGTDPEQRRFVATLAAAVSPDTVLVRELDVRQPDRDGSLTGQGRIALAGDIAADLEIRWQALQWPLTGEPTVTSPRGALSVVGPLNDYRFNLDTRLEPADTPPLDLAFQGSGDRTAASLSLEVQSDGGSASGEVRAAWDPVVEGDVSLQADGLDPAVLVADWPGNLNLRLQASGRSEGQRREVSISRLSADGQLRGLPLQAAGTGEFLQRASGYALDVPDFTASLGATRVTLGGQVAERADLRWQLESPDLSQLLPEARGSISGAGSITGTMPRVDVAAQLEGEGLGYLENTLEDLDLQADVDLSGDTPSKLQLTARNGSIGDTTVQNATLEGSGTPAAHRFDLALDADAGHAQLALDGALQDPWSDAPIWRFTLTRGELGYGDLAPWRLADPASGTVALPVVTVDDQCWAADDARLCLEGRRDAEIVTGRLTLANLKFAYFTPLLPEDLGLRGAVDATLSVSQPDADALLAEADIRTTAGELSLPAADPEAAATAIGLEPSRLRLNVDASEATGEAELVTEHGRVLVSATVSPTPPGAVAGPRSGFPLNRPLTDQPLTGRLQIDIPDLAFVTDFATAVQNMAGEVTGELAFGGTVGEPDLSGSLSLNDGALSLPQPGINLEAVTASVEGLGRQGLALRAAARSGAGNVELDGRLTPLGQAPAGRLTILGRNFEALNNDDGQVLVSPDLVVAADADRITVTGTVHVPEAELTPGAQEPAAVTVSEDQVLVNPESEGVAEQERELYAEVRLILGDEVHFEGFGLTARLEGDVVIDQEPATPTTATGEIRIPEGEYRAYGQGLVIDSGRIYFAGGPVTQPALDVRAVRRPAEDILVGAHVQGTLESPTFELFSEPPMVQQEQLSWLVLGRSLDESPEGQGDALSRAALAMGLRGGDFLAKNIGERAGLDQIGIETGTGEAGAPSDPSQAALVVGKYLSPKLYVSYGIGLFNPESVLEMQYEISRNWRLVTQSSGESTGADVLYSVELGGN